MKLSRFHPYRRLQLEPDLLPLLDDMREGIAPVCLSELEVPEEAEGWSDASLQAYLAQSCLEMRRDRQFLRFWDSGHEVIHFRPESASCARISDLSKVSLADLQLPLDHFFLFFGIQCCLSIEDGALYEIDGAYVSIERDTLPLPAPRNNTLHIHFATRQIVPTYVQSLMEGSVSDPVYTFTFPGGLMGLSVADAMPLCLQYARECSERRDEAVRHRSIETRLSYGNGWRASPPLSLECDRFERSQAFLDEGLRIVFGCLSRLSQSSLAAAVYPGGAPVELVRELSTSNDPERAREITDQLGEMGFHPARHAG